MNQELHAKKVTILSRLVKESSLTLEEALLLLEEEEESQIVQNPVQQPIWSGGGVYPSTYPNYPPYPPTTIVGTGTANGVGVLSTTGSNTTTTYMPADGIVSFTTTGTIADQNN